MCQCVWFATMSLHQFCLEMVQQWYAYMGMLKTDCCGYMESTYADTRECYVHVLDINSEGFPCRSILTLCALGGAWSWIWEFVRGRRRRLEICDCSKPMCCGNLKTRDPDMSVIFQNPIACRFFCWGGMGPRHFPNILNLQKFLIRPFIIGSY